MQKLADCAPYWVRYNESIKQANRPQRKTKPRAKYVKPESVRAFENEYNAHKYDKNPDFPAYARTRTTFRDDTANGLARLIEMHGLWYNYFVGRVNTTGIYDPKTGKFRNTGARKGMADLSAVVDGKPVQIEIKAGNDKPRTDQLATAAAYEKAGGLYVFVHNFDEWLQVYEQIRHINGENI